MKANEIKEKLKELNLRHHEDGDGGYILLSEVVQYAQSLEPDDKDLLRQELLRLVDAQDRTMWGVALESLVQVWKTGISEELESMLSHGQRSDEWVAQVLMALLRLHYRPIAKKALIHISSRIAAADRTVLPLLAALCKVDVEGCLDLAGPFLVGFVNDGQIDKLTGYVPAVVSHLLDADPNLLPMLIRKIRAEDTGAAVRIALLFCEYLDRPYMVEQLGNDATALLKARIKCETNDR